MAEDAILTEPGPQARERKALRADMHSRRQALPAAERMRAAEAVSQHLLADPAFADGYIAGYWAMGGEVPLHVLQMRLRPGQVWCLPCLEEDGRLRFAPWRPGDELVSNRFGIPEPSVLPNSRLSPESMAVILMPLLAFDAAGHRLGMGGGWYDRSLAFRHDTTAPPRLVGVGYGFQQVHALPSEPWDVPLDAVVTEAGLLDCTRAG